MGVQQAGPVLGLEPLFQVAVNEDFNVLAFRSDGEGGNFFRGSEVSEDQGAEDGRERAPVAHNVACEWDKKMLKIRRLQQRTIKTEKKEIRQYRTH